MSIIIRALIWLAVFFSLGYLFKIIIESYALRSKATLYNFIVDNSVSNRDLETLHLIIRKCEHLAQSAGNWTVPMIVIAQAAVDTRSNRSNFFEMLQQGIDSCQDEGVKLFLQLRKKSLEKYLLIYLFFWVTDYPVIGSSISLFVLFVLCVFSSLGFICAVSCSDLFSNS